MFEELTLLQGRLTEILAWFHGFCEENGLRYYMAYGTMLGAVRHGGFIPWDDDIDVAMPRPDYDRFIQITMGRRLDRFTVESLANGRRDWYYGYAKVYDTSTTLIENKHPVLKRGIYLDVFPLDGAADGEEGFRRAAEEISSLWHKRNHRKQLAGMLSVLSPRLLPSNAGVMLALDAAFRQFDYESSPMVGNLTEMSRKGMTAREIMPKSVFGTPRLYGFGDRSFYGVEDPDTYLKNLYDDYMTPPPPGKRTGHLVRIDYDLNVPFIE
ncbi:MAG: LicD family protein [Mailhella sp.]|nr:LicD family protein [Mailhella sp.]